MVAKVIQPSDPSGAASDGLANCAEADDRRASTSSERDGARGEKQGLSLSCRPRSSASLAYRTSATRTKATRRYLLRPASTGNTEERAVAAGFVTEDEGRVIAPFLFWGRFFRFPSARAPRHGHITERPRKRSRGLKSLRATTGALKISTFPKFPHQKTPEVWLTAFARRVRRVVPKLFGHLSPSSETSDGLASYTETDDGKA